MRLFLYAELMYSIIAIICMKMKLSTLRRNNNTKLHHYNFFDLLLFKFNLTLDNPVYGKSSKNILDSSPVCPCCCPLKINIQKIN